MPNLRFAWYIPLLLVLVYASFLLALISTTIQTNLLYLHKVKWPLFADYSRPQFYGAPSGTQNIRIATADGESLGAWHIPPALVPSDSSAGQGRRTILYFHGNAASRAQSSRVKHYKEWSNRLNCDVLSVDYRGFADSTGSPREDLILLDALAAWSYVIDDLGDATDVQERSQEVVLVGHSLGTAVASRLAAELAKTDVHPRAIVLIAPFTSLPELLLTYSLGPIPLLSPLARIPGAQDLLLTFLSETWNTTKALLTTQSPILLLHASDDLDIPVLHSSKLFHTFVNQNSGYAPQKAELSISTREGWGTVKRSSRSIGPSKDRSPVIWFESETGGHNKVGLREGVTELIAQVAGWTVLPGQVTERFDEVRGEL